jgi:hypothetical protein
MSTTFTIRPQTIADANIDIIAHIDEFADTWAGHRVASTYTWKIDTMISSIVNALFNTVRETYAAAHGIQSLNEVSSLLAFELDGAQAFHDAGFDRAGPVTNLFQLCCLRDEAYEIEKCMASYANPNIDVCVDRTDPVTGVVYKALFSKPELSEMFLHFEPRTPSKAERELHHTTLVQIASTHYDSEEERDAFVASELAAFDKAQLDECKRMNDGMARNAPLKQLILSEVLNLDLPRIDFFYELDTAVMRSVLTHFINSTPRTKEWNAKRYGVSHATKALAVAELDKFHRACEATLRTPRFNEGVQHQPAVRKPFRALA